jgi:hypothetical protein
LKKLLLCACILLLSAASAFAFDYEEYDNAEGRGAFIMNFDLGYDAMLCLSSSPMLASCFHMEGNFGIAPLPAFLHIEFNLGSVKVGNSNEFLVIGGIGFDWIDLISKNFGLGLGCCIGGPISADSPMVIPYVRLIYRFTTGLVSDGFYLDCLIHADLCYGFGDGNEVPTMPIIRLGIAVGYITAE